MQCKICKTEVTNDGHYFSKHKIRADEYFVNYFPRYDKLTKEPITFKSKEQYLTADFINRNNLKAYFKKATPQELQEYCKEFLRTRKEIKGIQFAPTEVELKSIVGPTIKHFNDVFDQGYEALCSELGLKAKFKTQKKFIPGPIFIPDGVMHVDSREQAPLSFNTAIKILKLNYGDYCFSDNPRNIFVERKSLTDFIGTLSSGFERFTNEIKRAQKDGAFLIILVESSFSNCLSFNYLPWVSKLIKATPEFIFHRVRELLQEFNHIQFVFVPNRQRAASLIEKIYFSDEDFRKFDIQLALEMEML